jgi:hypothetical protein
MKIQLIGPFDADVTFRREPSSGVNGLLCVTIQVGGIRVSAQMTLASAQFLHEKLGECLKPAPEDMTGV